jgi:hypothetical protein
MRNKLKRIQAQITNQRIFHIITSYQLANDEPDFYARFNDLLRQYPSPLIELAIVDVLVQAWMTIPLVRGLAFLELVALRLQEWQASGLTTTVTPDVFEQITGLSSELVSQAALKMNLQLWPEFKPM